MKPSVTTTTGVEKIVYKKDKYTQPQKVPKKDLSVNGLPSFPYEKCHQFLLYFILKYSTEVTVSIGLKNVLSFTLLPKIQLFKRGIEAVLKIFFTKFNRNHKPFCAIPCNDIMACSLLFVNLSSVLFIK